MLKMKRLYNQQIYPSEVFVVVADLHYHFSVIKVQRHNSQNFGTYKQCRILFSFDFSSAQRKCGPYTTNCVNIK